MKTKEPNSIYSKAIYVLLVTIITLFIAIDRYSVSKSQDRFENNLKLVDTLNAKMDIYLQIVNNEKHYIIEKMRKEK